MSKVKRYGKRVGFKWTYTDMVLASDYDLLSDQNSSLLATNYDLRKERDRMTDEIAALRAVIRKAALNREAAMDWIVLATDEPYCTCPDDYMAGVHHPDCISQKGDSTTEQP